MDEQYRAFFEAYLGPLPSTDVNGEVCISNPFRYDPNPSMHVNLSTGQYNDFGDDEIRGDAYAFFMLMHDADFGAAKESVEDWISGREARVQPIDIAYVEQWHSNLLANIPLRAYLTKERGLSVSTIKSQKIGWDGDRYTIPVMNRFGICVNVRRYDPKATGMKMISYKDGYGSNKLYPVEALTEDTIVIHEGEWDTLLQRSKGINAITATAGAGSWSKNWTEWFAGKTVYICYDVDEAGKKGARKVATQLSSVAKVHIINLPLQGTKDDKDISDYYLKRGNDVDEFNSLLHSAKLFVPTDEEAEAAKTTKKVSLVEARESKYKHQRVEFDVQVIGKDTAPYNVPYRGLYKCSQVGSNDKRCSGCGLAKFGGEIDLKIEVGPDTLDLIKASKTVRNSFMKSVANIPANCQSFTYEESESLNIEEILIAPEIPEFHSWDGRSSEYLVQTAYFAFKALESNRSYRMQGVMTPDPWQGHVTFVLDKAQPLQDTIESFKMTPEIQEKLKVFQAEDIAAKFDEIHADFSANVTHIVGREDLLTGIDLVYHSVLGFNFQGIPVQKGWLEFLCLGDTRTGKSETTEAMMRHFGLGEMSVAENTSYAGLVGGLQQTGDKRWFLTWGKLPLNDGRIFVIDEASGLSQDDIAKMSGIRSSGVAEITKIQTERTTARTRLIWLSNPRSGQPIAAYSHGIQAVAELIGKSEDIARFDFAMACTKEDVPIDAINKIRDDSQLPQHVYTKELCKQLILWAWSRTADNIVFEDESIVAILKYATTMGERYSARIPLVEGASQRIKLARLAVAVAARVFSTDETGEQVIVKLKHVEYAYEYLDRMYSMPSLNYRGYSAGDYLDVKAAIKNRVAVLTFLNGNPALAQICANTDFIWLRVLEEQLNLDRSGASELLSQLSQWRMLKDAGNKGYRKTPGFINILREWETTHEIDEYGG